MSLFDCYCYFVVIFVVVSGFGWGTVVFACVGGGGWRGWGEGEAMVGGGGGELGLHT